MSKPISEVLVGEDPNFDGTKMYRKFFPFVVVFTRDGLSIKEVRVNFYQYYKGKNGLDTPSVSKYYLITDLSIIPQFDSFIDKINATLQDVALLPFDVKDGVIINYHEKYN